MFTTLAAIDGNLVGLGTVSGTLVVALGYMLRDRRDTDNRVDRANAAVLAEVKHQRDEALADVGRLRDQLGRAYTEIDQLKQGTRILQYRLGLHEGNPDE
jgi:hypothetical protein